MQIAMHLDPSLPIATAIAAVVIGLGYLLRRLKMPLVVGYLLAGITLGPAGLGLLTDVELAARIGNYGVLLLLFFIGMEINLPSLVAGWRVAVLGTLAQIGISVLVAWLVGQWLDWPLQRALLLGFVTSLSSTSVVLEILRHSGELDSPVGRATIGILLAQDVAIVPMMIILGLSGGAPVPASQVTLQVIGAVGVIALIAYLARGNQLTLPLGPVREDHEMQVFVALGVCFGLSTLLGFMELSAPLGAFVAGLVVSAAREGHWFHERLESFRTVLVALFFVSVGLLVSVDFLVENWQIVSTMVAAALVVNTILNAGILRLLKRPWGESLSAGALLAPIGEFSFVLAAVGLQTEIIQNVAYQLTISVIFLSLLLAPLWQIPFRRWTARTPTQS